MREHEEELLAKIYATISIYTIIVLLLGGFVGYCIGMKHQNEPNRREAPFKVRDTIYITKEIVHYQWKDLQIGATE